MIAKTETETRRYYTVRTSHVHSVAILVSSRFSNVISNRRWHLHLPLNPTFVDRFIASRPPYNNNRFPGGWDSWPEGINF